MLRKRSQSRYFHLLDFSCREQHMLWFCNWGFSSLHNCMLTTAHTYRNRLGLYGSFLFIYFFFNYNLDITTLLPTVPHTKRWHFSFFANLLQWSSPTHESIFSMGGASEPAFCWRAHVKFLSTSYIGWIQRKPLPPHTRWIFHLNL